MYVNRTKMIIKNVSISDISHNSNAISTLETSTTNTVIPGSTISYTPVSGSSKVVYEFHMQFHNDPDSHNATFIELQNDLVGNGTWTVVGTSYRIGDLSVYSSFQGLSIGRFLLPSWTGSRSLRLLTNSYSSNYQCTLHEDEAGNHFDPIIKVYSIM